MLTTLTISNKGLRAVGDEIETRKKVEIKLWVHADNYDESLFIAAEVADPQEKTEPLVYNASPTREDGAASWEITFKRPFLHSDLGLGGKAPQERIQLAILSNTNVTLAKVAGTGLGWRARIRPDYTALNRALFIFVGALILFFVLAAIIRLFQLDLDEPISASIFAILFVTDLLVGIGALAAVLWFATVRLLERTLRGFKRS